MKFGAAAGELALTVKLLPGRTQGVSAVVFTLTTREDAMPRSKVLIALAIAGLMCVAARKAPDKVPFEDYADRIVTGDALTEAEMAEARKGFTSQLIRPDQLDFGENARYRIAEIQLSHGKAREAVSTLREVVSAQPKPDETIWVTRFNIAEILCVALNDVDQAAAEFQQVEGTLQPLAQREMLDMIEKDPKRLDQAVSMIRKAAAETKEKGARWALLTRLGSLYRRAQQDEKALEVFRQIAQEATPDQIERLREQATGQVQEAAKQIRRLRDDDRDDEAENIEQEVVRQCNALRIQGRDDEADAMQAALDKLDEELKNPHPPAGAFMPPAAQGKFCGV
jgi:tetratricopeptide (TPR) repeat protein